MTKLLKKITTFNLYKMKKIDLSAYYSLRDAVSFTPLKARETLARYVNRYQGADWSIGKVWIKRKAIGKSNTSVRYIISGEWIKEFVKRYNAGKLSEHSIFSTDDLRYTLKDIINYCRKNNISTVQAFIKKKLDEEQKNISPIRNK